MSTTKNTVSSVGRFKIGHLLSAVLASVCLFGDASSYVVPGQGYVRTNGLGSNVARLSLAEHNSYHHREHKGPGTYAFGYDVDDAPTGNTQFREEERHPNGTVTGSYGYVEPDGNVHTVFYVADHLGYRVRIENSRDKLKLAPAPPVIVPAATITSKIPSLSLTSRPIAINPINPTPILGPSNTPLSKTPLIYEPASDLQLPYFDYNPYVGTQRKYYDRNYYYPTSAPYYGK